MFLPTTWPESISIRLERGRLLTGRVTSACPNAPLSRLHVAVGPDTLFEGPRLSHLLADPRVRIVNPRPDGVFEIDCVPENQPVFLAVGGAGWTEIVESPRLAADVSTVTVEVGPVAAVIVRILDEVGEAARLNRVGGMEWGVSVTPGSGGMRLAKASMWARILAGVPELRRDSGSNEQVFVWAASCGEDDRSIRIRGSYPGYAPIVAETTVPRLEERLGTVEVVLSRLHDEYGHIRLRSKSASDQSGRTCPAGVLGLRTPEGRQYDYVIDRFENGASTVDSIPPGPYDALFQWWPVSDSVDGSPQSWRAIRVTPGGTTDLDVDLPTAASVELRVVDEAGHPYFGRARFLVGRLETLPAGMTGEYAIAGRTVDYLHGPYTMPVVPPGQLSILLLPVGGRVAERLDLLIPTSGRTEAVMHLSQPAVRHPKPSSVFGLGQEAR